MRFPCFETRSQKRKRRERAKQRSERDKPRPLPTVRPRALTLRSSDDHLQPDSIALSGGDIRPGGKGPSRVSEKIVQPRQSTIDQLGACSFYRLPLEVRENIWRLAVGGSRIHIVKRRGKLGNVYCVEDVPDIDRRDLCCMSRTLDGFYVPTAWPTDVRPLSLIASCRQIYSETIDILYSSNTFSFDEFDTLVLFFDNLLSHRRHLISSVDFTFDFRSPRGIATLKGFAQTYIPKNFSLFMWTEVLRRLHRLPRLRSFALRSPVLAEATWYEADLERPHDWIKDFIRLLNMLEFDGSFSVAWPSNSRLQGTLSPAWAWRWWGDVRNLPTDPKFEIEGLAEVDKPELLFFFVPFNVQCLHCHSSTIIRKGTAGYAETLLKRGESIARECAAIARGQTYNEPELSRYWTYHARCKGWIEFQYDWTTGRWSVTQGAREISDEEADEHLKKDPQSYPELESLHERLQGVTVKKSSSPCGDWSGTKIIDIPTKERFYFNAGWSTT